MALDSINIQIFINLHYVTVTWVSKFNLGSDFQRHHPVGEQIMADFILRPQSLTSQQREISSLCQVP